VFEIYHLNLIKNFLIFLIEPSGTANLPFTTLFSRFFSLGSSLIQWDTIEIIIGLYNKRLNNCVFKQKLSLEVDEKETEEKIEEHYKSTNVSKAIEDLEKLRLLLYRL